MTRAWHIETCVPCQTYSKWLIIREALRRAREAPVDPSEAAVLAVTHGHNASVEVYA